MKIEELFFEVDINNISYPTIPSGYKEDRSYKVVTHNNVFLGAKKAKSVIHELTGYEETKDILIFNHREAYDFVKTLFEFTFGKSGSLYKWYNSENKNWAAFFISSSTSLSKIIKDKFIGKKQNEKFQNISFEDIDIADFDKFEPIIGVTNGFDYEDNLAFYLILVIPDTILSNQTQLLSISDYKLSENQVDTLLDISTPKKRCQKVIEYLEYFASKKFNSAITDFVFYYNTFRKIKINLDLLTPISLDIYDKNRSYTSIELDEKLRNSLDYLIKTGYDFFYTNEKGDLSAIIDFIMRINLFDLENHSLPREKVEQIFVQKKPYRKSIRIFTKFNQQANIERYSNEQAATFSEVKKILKLER